MKPVIAESASPTTRKRHNSRSKASHSEGQVSHFLMTSTGQIQQEGTGNILKM